MGPGGRCWSAQGSVRCTQHPECVRDAELLSQSLLSALSGEQTFDAALADYERARNEQTLADYHDNAARAQFPPVEPQVLQLRRALRENPEQTRQFYLAFERRIPPKSFFNPENIAKIVGRGAGSRAAASELSGKT